MKQIKIDKKTLMKKQIIKKYSITFNLKHKSYDIYKCFFGEYYLIFLYIMPITLFPEKKLK